MDTAGADGGKRLGSGILGAAKSFVAPLAGLFAVSAGVAFFKGAITGASDLAESQSKVGVVFGTASAQILTASKTAATAMGLSQSAYLAATGGLGNLLVSLNVAPKAAADMSQQMVALAGDMASFNNVSPEEALAAIQSGLTGETEPLKKFGVNMNDATLKAEALKLGLISSTKDAMDPQTKALAAQSLIMSQTGTAQGDFARTSDGLANQQRILAAQTEDLKTKIGNVLLPVMTGVATFLNVNMIPAFNASGTVIKNVAGFVMQNKEAFIALGAVIALVTVATLAHSAVLAVAAAGGLASYISSLGIVRTATAVWTAVQWVLNAALTANPIGIVIMVIVALAAAIVIAYKNSETFRNVVTGAWNDIKSVAGTVVGWFTGTLFPALSAAWQVVAPLFSAVGDLIGAVFARIGQYFTFMWTNVYQPILSLIIAYWKFVWSGISAIWDAIGPPLMAFIAAGWQILATILGAVWDGIKTVLSGVWDVIVIVVRTAIAVVTGVIRTATALIKGDWSGAWNAIKGVLSAVWDGITGVVSTGIGTVVDLVKGIPRLLSNLGSLLYNSGKDLIQGLLDGAGSLLSKLGSFFLDKVPAFIREPFKKALGIASPSKVFAGYGANVGQGFIQGVDSMESQINASMSAMVGISSVPNLNANVSSMAGSGNAGSGAAVTQNVYPTPGLSEQQIGDAAARQLAWAMRG